MTDFIGNLSGIADRIGLHYGELAVLCGVSAPTMRVVLMTRALPKRTGARRRIEAFVSLNRDVRRRSDIRLADPL